MGTRCTSESHTNILEIYDQQTGSRQRPQLDLEVYSILNSVTSVDSYLLIHIDFDAWPLAHLRNLHETCLKDSPEVESANIIQLCDESLVLLRHLLGNHRFL